MCITEEMPHSEKITRLTHSCCSKCHQNPLIKGTKCLIEPKNCYIVNQYIENNLS